jgi:hypothetical protein
MQYYFQSEKKNIIKCSQCDAEFPHGYAYRVHWEEAHLDDAIEYAKIHGKTYVEQRVEKKYRLP